MSDKRHGNVKAGATSLTCYFMLRKTADSTEQTAKVYTDFTGSYVRSGGSRTAITMATQTVTGAYSSGGLVEVDATNIPGLYRFDPPDACFASGVESVVIALKCASCFVEPWEFAIESAGSSEIKAVLPAALTTDGNIKADALRLGGTLQTGRDLGASVLLSSGTGTGQLDFTGGVVKANLAQILGTALTETTGQIAAAFKKFFNIATPASTMDALTLVATAANVTNAVTLTGAYDAAKTAASATALANLQTHGDTTWATATGFATATALANLQTHGDATWATSTGFAAATALAALQTHGDGTWATATGFAVPSDIPTAAAIASQANTTLTAAHGAGSWQQGTGGGGGGSGLSGPSAVTLTFHDGAGNPVPLVDFTIVGQGVGRSLTDGTASFGLDDGDYTVVARTTAGVIFPTTDIIVAVFGAYTITGAALVLPTPADPNQLSAFTYTRDGQDALQPAVTITFSLEQTPGGDSYGTAPFTATSDSSALLTVSLRKLTKYSARRGTGPAYEFTTGSVTPFEIPQILGP